MTTATLNRITGHANLSGTTPDAKENVPTQDEGFPLAGVWFLLGSIAMTMLVMVGVILWAAPIF